MQLRLDRFTFKNDTKCFIQLANDHQAQEAIQRLNNAKLHGKPISVKPLGAGFQWSRPDRAGKDRETSRSFFQFNEEGNEVAEALKPLLEGRRCILRVQPPGWGSKQGTMSKNKAARQVVNKYMGQFGIEVVGGMSAFFGDKRDEPRLLCIIDFATKEGAEAAIKAINNTVIEDRRTLLEVSKMAPWRAHQVGLVDQKLLKQLQEADLASQKTYPDKYPVSSSVPIEKKM
jgi:RNA recognition motif-containing protein